MIPETPALPRQVLAPGAAPSLRVSVAEARRLPPTVLMSSCADKIVPW